MSTPVHPPRIELARIAFLCNKILNLAFPLPSLQNSIDFETLIVRFSHFLNLLLVKFPFYNLASEIDEFVRYRHCRKLRCDFTNFFRPLTQVSFAKWSTSELSAMQCFHLYDFRVFIGYYSCQNGGEIPIFFGPRFQRGHGLGSILGGFFRRLVLPFPGTKILASAVKTGMQVADDVMEGQNFRVGKKTGYRSYKTHGAQSESSVWFWRREEKTCYEKIERYLCMMAFVHKQSCECTKSKLDLFSVPPTQTSMEHGSWIEYHPLTTVSDGSPIAFDVSGSGEDYIDFANTMMYIKAKITRNYGANLQDDAEVGPDNLNLHSLFSQVNISLNGTVITASTNTYPYRAMIETLLTYGEDAKERQLT